MESDIAQIKLLLWIILGLMALFVASNILCRIFNCGQPRPPHFADLWNRGKIDELILKAEQHLREFPQDMDALFFGAKALAAKGLFVEARSYLQRLLVSDPTLRELCTKELKAIDEMANGS
jgi:tetratricopeptide (TPR) repeat protein